MFAKQQHRVHFCAPLAPQSEIAYPTKLYLSSPPSQPRCARPDMRGTKRKGATLTVSVVHNVGHRSFKPVGSFPCRNHVFKYGDLTASGSAGALKGEALQFVGPFWACTTTVLDRRDIARKGSRRIGGEKGERRGNASHGHTYR